MQVKSKKELNKTALYNKHVELNANIVEFAGWMMPLHYSSGIIKEHLSTRKGAGLFDVSHMGRFIISGKQSLNYLQYVLTNNASSLSDYDSQYTIISDDCGYAIDDTYLYHLAGDEYLLVVNAANKDSDWDRLTTNISEFRNVKIVDKSADLSMLSLQGPLSKEILLGIISNGYLPEPSRNKMSITQIDGVKVLIARTGYTGEPLCFELFIDSGNCIKVWDKLIQTGAVPVGLGARDTLRLEAGLPLYGNELGTDPEGRKIPIFSVNLARFAVSFSQCKGSFIGRQALTAQFNALKGILNRGYSLIGNLPRLVMPLELTGGGIARKGSKVYYKNKHVGYITSGTSVPYWKSIGNGITATFSDEIGSRSICLALLDSDLYEDMEVEIDIRGKRYNAIIMPYLLKSDAAPYARTISSKYYFLKKDEITSDNVSQNYIDSVNILLKKSISNTLWRQKECINLIPSEQTPSKFVKLLSIMDPAGRYAEHKKLEAFYDKEVFFYQGTAFIAEVEKLLSKEIKKYLSCSQVETRAISGQMANMIVFSTLVDFFNRADAKSEYKRIHQILNHHIMAGGHLSAQPMGALKDFVRKDPKTDRYAVINFPVLKEDPYQIDLKETQKLIEKHKPRLIIFGKSMTIYKEPVSKIKKFIQDLNLDCLVLYDMAHVLGLVGKYFQEPFNEGADIVTASTHKTFFGTQRGIISSNFIKPDLYYQLWKAIEKRTFPGSTSNHHLGTLLGLLMASYEMNYFKDDYQKNVISNAKAFAKALKNCGLNVAGNSDLGYTQTHQVIIDVGSFKAPLIAKVLEDNNIIVNYQATYRDEGFTASGSIRMGVAEMTRFGMEEKDFEELAQLIYEVIKKQRNVKNEIINVRQRFLKMKYCFSENMFKELLGQINDLM